MATHNPAAALDLLAGLPVDELRARIDAARCVQSFAHFAKQAWPIFHSFPMIHAWYVDCIGEHCEAVHAGQIEWLLISIMPGVAKSLLVSVLFPAWVWTKDPGYQFLCSGAAEAVVLRDARRHQEVCQSPWYQRAFLPQWEMLASQNAKGYFVNTAGGHRISRTCNSDMTGLRGDCRIGDDLLDANKAYLDKTWIDKTNDWLDNTFLKRRNTQTSALINIQQRLNERDPTGFLLEKGHPNTVHLCLPNEYRPSVVLDTGVLCRATGEPWEDPRTEEGELLCPAILNEAGTAEEKENEIIYQAQYQQDPMPAGGTIFKQEDYRYWVYTKEEAEAVNADPEWPNAVVLPEKFDRVVLSLDPNNLKAVRATRNTDYAVLDAWGAIERDRYLIRQIREKLGVGATIRLTMRAIEEYKPDKIYIERSANGPSVISAVKAELGLPDKDNGYVVAVSVQGESKTQRAVAASPIVEAGRVYLPHPALYGDTRYILMEYCGFPGRRRDDRVDTKTMALLELEKDQGQQVWTMSMKRKKDE